MCEGLLKTKMVWGCVCVGAHARGLDFLRPPPLSRRAPPPPTTTEPADIRHRRRQSSRMFFFFKRGRVR
jgi:hypothetical protein